MKLPDFNTKKELFDFLVKNKETLIAQKKAEMKRADSFPFVLPLPEVGVTKAEAQAGNSDSIEVRAIINTTNLFDSHRDVHMPGIWDKSLKENRRIMHLQEHRMAFDHMISEGDDLKTYTKTYSWKELGFNFAGKTQALVFDSNVTTNRTIKELKL